ncbi:MAG: hypothetical protein H0V00_16805 [Chloroflexia bacterium]|nr:hypothetical protein [Chloroflexia bacterium]
MVRPIDYVLLCDRRVGPVAAGVLEASFTGMTRGLDLDTEQESLFPGERIARPGIDMAHRVPGKREVDLYVRTYTTLLQSSGAIPVSSLVPAHLTASSSLHAGAAEPEPDLNAFIYSTQRLPESIVDVSEIVLGQSARDFRRNGYTGMELWQIVSAPGRRRRWRYDGKALLAATIASASDLDDLIPSIVSYQIEWNKMHGIIAADAALKSLIARAATGEDMEERETAEVGERLLLRAPGWERLKGVWGASLWRNLDLVAEHRKRYTVQMIGGSHLGNARATHQWWLPAERVLHELSAAERPVYFVSSNTHSIVNVLSGTARRRKRELTEYVRTEGDFELKEELAQLEEGTSRSNWENLLYFAARQYFSGAVRAEARLERSKEERAVGIHHIDATGAVDVGIQIIELAKLDPQQFDPRLCGADGVCLDPRRSEAIIVNVNYPLGLTAYNIMTQVGMTTDELQGIYILGKAATLNGRIGDVMISDVVYDEHSGNTYSFDNAFRYADLAPFLDYGAALDNQKAVTVKGTFLQNEGYLDFFYRENYTVVEMEAGPYLNALYEDLYLRRFPSGEAINLQTHRPGTLDLGIIHYASDTPYTRAQTLGARGLSYRGLDSTYASTVAILRRVLHQATIPADANLTMAAPVSQQGAVA